MNFLFLVIYFLMYLEADCIKLHVKGEKQSMGVQHLSVPMQSTEQRVMFEP
jgi:hypothetical protein